MSVYTDEALRRLFSAGSVAETKSFADTHINRLRRKGLIRSERAEDYWRWRHELTPAGIAERARVLEEAGT